MALRVWLPLNGNLNNQGLSNTIVTVSGATINNNGKIGKTYLFDANDDYISIDSADLRDCFKGGANPFTIAMWIYNTKTTGARGVPFGDYSLSESIGFNLELNSSGGSYNDDIRFYWNGSPDYRATNTNIAPNTWVHLTVVYDGEKVDFYRNGILVNTRTGTLADRNKTAGVFYLGRDGRTGGTAFGGYLNDFRVYDEALSLKQIKEISKGLVAHYKLTGVEANPNLAKNTNTDSLSTNAAYYHEATGGHTRSLEYDENGIPCICFTRNNTSHSGWQYLSYDNFDRAAITTNTTYTVSVDIKASVDGSLSLTGLLNGNATNYMTNSSTTINGTIQANKWNHLVFTCTTISDFSSITVGSQVIYWSMSNSLLGTGISLWIKNVKLEKGSIETNYIPNVNDTKYSTLGYENDICTDVSGNGYTATKSGTLTFNSDSPRYSGSTYFNGSSYLTSVSGSMSWFPFDNLTISAWIKPTVKPGNWTGSIGIQQNAGSNGKIFSISNYAGNFSVHTDNGSSWVTTQSNELPLNTWSYCVATLTNGTDLKMYIDGVQVKTATLDYGSATAKSDTRIAIGVDLPGDDEKYTGYYSDVKIYATALSADDILTMYKNSGIIDNEGNVYAYEFKEE